MGHLIVIVHVIDDTCHCAQASDFTIRVSGNHQTPDVFNGSESGTNVTLGVGDYRVEVATNPPNVVGAGYLFGEDCDGVIHADETKTCTVRIDII